jgi:multimeric flavodoxin WrbA
MNRRTLPTWLPFAWLIALNSLAVATGYRIGALTPLLPIIAALVVVNLVVAVLMKVDHYFTYAVSGVTLLGIAAVFLVPEPIGELFVHNAIAALYLALLLAAVVPPLLGMVPFTHAFSRGAYPPAIVASDQFRRINLVMNALWAGLFAIAIVLSVIPYAQDSGVQVIISSLVPIALLLSVGVPMNRLLPARLMQSTPGERLHFESLAELFEAMPHGLNRKLAEGVDALVQFHLDGDEPLEGYLEIRDQAAVFTLGVHPQPKTTIRADSTLWLQISNGEVSGDRAYMNDEYEASGDLTILLSLDELFAPPQAQEEQPSAACAGSPFAYGDLGRPLRRVVVFDGGPRSSSLSRTTMMVTRFCEGARAAGAEVEVVQLRRKKIADCTGCYRCWTETPGVCIFDGDKVEDDMAELRRELREADLVVLATPLYIFSATALMKRFLDRTLPNIQPYMLIDEQGMTMHPHRYEQDPEQGLVVFSAAGFPDVAHNFDGLQGMVRCMASHFEKQSLLAELYLPAAELLFQPVYADRLERVLGACFEAGRQAAGDGRVDPELMASIADPGISSRKFQEQADIFWELLDGEGSYLKDAPRLPPTS